MDFSKVKPLVYLTGAEHNNYNNNVVKPFNDMLALCIDKGLSNNQALVYNAFNGLLNTFYFDLSVAKNREAQISQQARKDHELKYKHYYDLVSWIEKHF